MRQQSCTKCHKIGHNKRTCDTISENICPICHDVLGTNNVLTTPCGHTYCMTCMLSHLSIQNNCPICRAPIEFKRFQSTTISDVETTEIVWQQLYIMPLTRMLQDIFSITDFHWIDIPIRRRSIIRSIIHEHIIGFGIDLISTFSHRMQHDHSIHELTTE